MKKIILFAGFASIFGVSSFASEWNYFFSPTTDETAFYFDAASVTKANAIVNLWVKTVQLNKPAAEDESWSTAMNYRVNCQNRTIQLLGWSTYDAAEKFIKSNSNANVAKVVIPDSIGESIHRTACMVDFPKNTPTTKGSYLKLDLNDPFAATKRLSEGMKSQVDNAPK